MLLVEAQAFRLLLVQVEMLSPLDANMMRCNAQKASTGNKSSCQSSWCNKQEKQHPGHAHALMMM